MGTFLIGRMINIVHEERTLVDNQNLSCISHSLSMLHSSNSRNLQISSYSLPPFVSLSSFLEEIEGYNASKSIFPFRILSVHFSFISQEGVH